MQNLIILIIVIILIFLLISNLGFKLAVVSVASLILIIMLAFVGYSLYAHNFNQKFPPVTAECPDFWTIKEKNICENPKNLGNCTGPVNFNQERFQGAEGDCNKSKWAQSCNVSWSGITNNSSICDKIDPDN